MIVVCRTRPTSLTYAADKRLRSSSRNLLLVPRSSEKFGDCSFSIAGILNEADFPTMRRTHHLGRHLNRPTSSKPIFSYNRITDKLCGSQAWKHTFTRGYTSSVGVQHGNTHSHKRIIIQALWGSSINTIGYTSSVGVQPGNTHAHWIYKRPWESSMETHIHTREYTHMRKFGPDLGGSRIIILKSMQFRRVTIQCF